MLTLAEKGNTYTVLACVSTSGQVLPSFMVYPRKHPVAEKMKEGPYPNRVEILFVWFKPFVPLRSMLVALDRSGSHITVDVIEYARRNTPTTCTFVHVCLPSHICTCILQPVDVGVVKTFTNFMYVVKTQEES